MEITLEQRIAIYKAMDALVEIQTTAWGDIKTKGFDFNCKEAKIHDTADEAWWKLQELWKFFE